MCKNIIKYYLKIFLNKLNNMVVVKLPSGKEVDISTPVYYKRRLFLTSLFYIAAFLWLSFRTYLLVKKFLFI
jgi:hypothetical protein